MQALTYVYPAQPSLTFNHVKHTLPLPNGGQKLIHADGKVSFVPPGYVRIEAARAR